MNYSVHEATAHLLRRLNEVLHRLDGTAPVLDNPNTRFAEALDSMTMVELLVVLAEDYGVTASAIEECAGHRFGTVAELAACLHASRWVPAAQTFVKQPVVPRRTCWLAATAMRLPDTVQHAACINAALQRPAGWLERHAGIEQRGIWADQDPLNSSAR